jgi:hypothetical protein
MQPVRTECFLLNLRIRGNLLDSVAPPSWRHFPARFQRYGDRIAQVFCGHYASQKSPALTFWFFSLPRLAGMSQGFDFRRRLAVCFQAGIELLIFNRRDQREPLTCL